MGTTSVESPFDDAIDWSNLVPAFESSTVTIFSLNFPPCPFKNAFPVAVCPTPPGPENVTVGSLKYPWPL